MLIMLLLFERRVSMNAPRVLRSIGATILMVALAFSGVALLYGNLHASGYGLLAGAFGTLLILMS
jgi:hypothetical protein